jgi:hypothetical protein
MSTTQTYQEQLTANSFYPTSAFDLTYTPINNSLMVFINGNFQTINQDYVWSRDEIITTSIIPSGIDVRAAYSYTEQPSPDPAENCHPDYTLTRIQETLTPANTALSTEFTFTHTPEPNHYFIFQNGQILRDTIDYSITGSTLTTTNPTTASLYADYYYRVERDTVLPRGWSGSTTLNHAITSYELLAERIKMQLGYPVVRIEICDEQIYDAIDQAVEWYTKYAGHTEEYLVFNSLKVYKCGLGVKLDDLFSSFYQYQCDGCEDHLSKVTGQFYDCDKNAYRKVVDVFSVEPVEQTGTNVLFSMDYMFAQQTYFSYLLGSFGFDLVTWHILKEWLDLRKKMFATDPYVRFDKRSQYMKVIPEPTRTKAYLGVIGCWVERTIADVVQERWVLAYAMALTKIMLGHIRGKYGALTLFGGGSLNASDIMLQGTKEKETLEQELMDGAGESAPAPWHMG